MKPSMRIFDMKTGLALISLSIFLKPSSARNFRQASLPGQEEVEASLLDALAGTISGQNLENIKFVEAKLQPMVAAMPKNPDGSVTLTLAFYILHRFFAQRGWHITGLEQSGDWHSGGGQQEPNASLRNNNWLPTFLHGFLTELKDGKGIHMRELAILATTLQDVIDQEYSYYLSKTIHMSGSGFRKKFDTQTTDAVLESYLINYIGGRNRAASPGGFIHMRWDKANFIEQRKDWNETMQWMQGVRESMQPAGTQVDLGNLTAIVRVVNDRYGDLKEKQCDALKSELLAVESEKVGRIRLSEFYKLSLDAMLEKQSISKFNEQQDYLQALGAIDDSDPKDPHVIIPNYITSTPLCSMVSDYYTVCCQNQCEAFMGTLEGAIKSEFASPEELLRLVSKMASDTVEAPRKLSHDLTARLQSIADVHAGIVPLHGRAFSQWMHHAFPRECPFPHAAGSAKPQTPDAYMRAGRWTKTAQLNSQEIAKGLDNIAPGWRADAVEEAVPEDVNAPLMLKHIKPKVVAATKKPVRNAELPWGDAEELLIPAEAVHTQGFWTRTVRSVVYFVTLSSMAYALKKFLFSRQDMYWLESGQTKFV